MIYKIIKDIMKKVICIENPYNMPWIVVWSWAIREVEKEFEVKLNEKSKPVKMYKFTHMDKQFEASWFVEATDKEIEKIEKEKKTKKLTKEQLNSLPF